MRTVKALGSIMNGGFHVGGGTILQIPNGRTCSLMDSMYLPCIMRHRPGHQHGSRCARQRCNATYRVIEFLGRRVEDRAFWHVIQGFDVFFRFLCSSPSACTHLVGLLLSLATVCRRFWLLLRPRRILGGLGLRSFRGLPSLFAGTFDGLLRRVSLSSAAIPARLVGHP